MREIKFRGKRISDGEWFYGDLVTVADVDLAVKRSFIHIRLSDVGFVEDSLTAQVCLHEVDFQTVGQYTGLKDKNGVEIYEGDIVKSVTDVYEVIINEFTQIPVIDSEIGQGELYRYHKDLEVIGNIYESYKLNKINL